jgi:hypothetical protein
MGWYFYTSFISDKELRDAIAEADRLDPGWRLEELEAKRAVIPAAENLADNVLAIKAMLPQPWLPESMTKVPPPNPVRSNEPPPVSLEEAIYDLPPEMQMSPEQTRELRAALEKVKEPLAKARALPSYRAGRYQVTWSLDFVSTRITCQDAEWVTKLLCHDARLRAQNADIEGAFISVQGILSIVRSIGDEPYAISQIIRMRQSRAATEALEGILAQGQASPNSLANVQRAFEGEASQPLFLFGIRGERAGWHRMIEAIERGELKVSSTPGVGLGTPPKGKLEAWWIDVGGKIMFQRSHGPLIRVTTEIVEIAKLPIEEQRQRLKSYMRSVDEDPRTPILVRLLVPSLGRVGEGSCRNQARLLCAIVALAAERYRLVHGHWPESLISLVPQFLSKVPVDPYDAKPLRYRRLEECVVIYSIGPDDVDNGGKIDRQYPGKSEGTDIGFQLWDVNKRRQPWRPPAKPKDEDDD